MESKYINRYNTFCSSLKNLEKSRHADPKADFVLEGTVLNFNLTFDISWKVMKDILIKQLVNLINLHNDWPKVERQVRPLLSFPVSAPPLSND